MHTTIKRYCVKTVVAKTDEGNISQELNSHLMLTSVKALFRACLDGVEK